MGSNKGFNAKMVGTFGVSTAAAVIILSERGPGIVQTLRSLPELLATWTQQSPIGLWTLLAALVLPAMLSLKLGAWLGAWSNRHAKETMVDLAGFAGAIAIAYVLMPGLPGLLIGFFCASLVSTLTLWLRAINLWLARALSDFSSDPEPVTPKPRRYTRPTAPPAPPADPQE